jgi:UDP-N-acetylmuramate dehydrogenase
VTVLKLQADAPLQSHNTLALKARATALVSVSSEAELLAALDWASVRGLPVIPLGAGSNILLARDLDALVLTQASRGIEVLDTATDSISLRVCAGENWHNFVKWTLHQGYYGLENLALIPGTVGAAPIQNIGAYGVEIKSSLLRIHATSIAAGKKMTLSRAECEFGYRDSVFKHRLRDQLVITAVDIELSSRPEVNVTYPALASALGDNADATTPREVFDAVVNLRRSKLPDPAVEPNAGSFYKNPVLRVERAQELVEQFPYLPHYPQGDGLVKLPAAWLIEHCGWKGYRKNDLGVHPQHALVLVNYGSDSGEQLLGLAREISASVNSTFGVDLDMEPRVYGQEA